jgi:hypothetical protein
VRLALGGILAQKLGQKDNEMFDQSQLQTANQTQHNRNMAKMILSKPLCIIVWMYPDMMR